MRTVLNNFHRKPLQERVNQVNIKIHFYELLPIMQFYDLKH